MIGIGWKVADELSVKRKIIRCFVKGPLLIILVLSALLSRGAAQEWEVYTDVDSMTDRVKRLAFIRNDEGFVFGLTRVEDNSVWAIFRLPESSHIILGHDHLMFRVDKKKPVTIGRLDSLPDGSPLSMFRQSEIGFHVWHGKGRLPKTGLLADILKGRTIRFRYTIWPEGSGETVFSLDGGAEKIRSVLFPSNSP